MTHLPPHDVSDLLLAPLAGQRGLVLTHEDRRLVLGISANVLAYVLD